MKKTTILNKLIKENETFVFVSPHLDDAALSCGSLIADLTKKGKKVIVINIFTKAHKGPYTGSARKFIKSCGNYTNAEKLFQYRVKEDKNALSFLGVKDIINLNFQDALFRKKRESDSILAKILPETSHIYPTYKFNVVKGAVADYDKGLIIFIKKRIKNILRDTQSKTVIFCPIAIGNHIDHVITRKITEEMFSPIYWQDQPYASNFDITKNVGEFVLLFDSKTHMEKKKTALGFYKSQISPMFNNKIPYLEEKYFSKPISFPEILNGYKFIKEILKDKRPKPFSYGLYMDKNGKKAFSKHVTSNDYRNYLALRNEIEAYKLISRTENDPQIKKSFPSFSFPTFLGYKINKNSATLLISHTPGQHLAHFSIKEKIKAYKEAFDFLEAINKRLVKLPKKTINTRSISHWIFALPYLSIRAFLRYPKYTPYILSANFLVLRKLTLLKGTQSESFVHGDLGDWNILLNNKKIIIYDLQQACLSNHLLEYAITLVKTSKQKPLTRSISTEIIQNKLSDKEAEILIMLCICVAMYDVAFENKNLAENAISLIKGRLRITHSKTMLKFDVGLLIRDFILFLQSPKELLFSFTYSEQEKIRVRKYNPKSRKIAEKFIRKINKKIPELKIKLIGSTQYGIAGENDIDLLSNVPIKKLDKYYSLLLPLIGKPHKRRRQYVEWIIKLDDYQIEFNIMDPTLSSYKRRIKAFKLLTNNKNLRSEYENLKLSLNGASKREYEKRKLEFFNRFTK